MNMREALVAALRRDPELIPKVAKHVRERRDLDDRADGAVVQAAEALEPILADAVRKRPSRLGRLGLKTSHLLASMAAEDVGSNRRLASISRNSSVGIAFVDICDFMAFTARVGDEAAAELLARFEGLTERAIARPRGEVVKKLGDGFLVAFPSASQAVRGMVALRAAIDRRNATLAAADAVRVRIAIHAGEPLVEQDDLLGHDVNLAARLLDHCRPDEIVVSEAAADLAAKRLRTVTFGRRRRVKIRGLASRVVLYSVQGRAPD